MAAAAAHRGARCPVVVRHAEGPLLWVATHRRAGGLHRWGHSIGSAQGLTTRTAIAVGSADDGEEGGELAAGAAPQWRRGRGAWMSRLPGASHMKNFTFVRAQTFQMHFTLKLCCSLEEHFVG
jgi:hypothetical protein